jgi:hypothetical protein
MRAGRILEQLIHIGLDIACLVQRLDAHVVVHGVADGTGTLGIACFGAVALAGRVDQKVETGCQLMGLGGTCPLVGELMVTPNLDS